MKRKIYISPSLLAADKNNLVSESLKVQKLGCKYIHFDVMDGIFVPAINFGLETLKDLHNKHKMINDVHIMVHNPLVLASAYAKTGADIVTFHYEALDNDVQRDATINTIRLNGAKVGMSIKPNTPVDVILPFLRKLDLVLIMSVEPGKGGQKFIEESLDKIKICREYIDKNKLKTLIEVDGGINEETSKLVKERNVDMLVAGSFIIKSDNYASQINKLK
jgi:ribulose-phosphate 3-epimerase